MSSSFHGNSEEKPGRLWLAGRLGRVVPYQRVWRGSPGHWCRQRYWNQDQGSSLFSHTTGERKGRQNKTDRKKIKEKQVKVKCTDQKNLYVSIERTACTHGNHAFMCRGTRFGSYVGGLQFRTTDTITVNKIYCCSQISGCLCPSGHTKLCATLHFNNHNHKVAEKSSINEIWTEQ